MTLRSVSGIRRRLLLAAGTLVVVAGLLEGVGRLLPGATIPPNAGDLVQPDEELGWALTPNGFARSFRTSIQTNSLGLRSPEPRNLPGSLRVLLLGDSTVFGFGVHQEATFGAVLQNALASRGPVDVQSGGVPGYTCPQSRRQRERLAPRFPADLVLVYNLNSDQRMARSGDRIYLGAGSGLLWHTGTGRLLTAGVVALRRWKEASRTPLEAYTSCLAGLAGDVRADGGSPVFVMPIVDADTAVGAAAGSGQPGGAVQDYPMDPALVADFRDAMRGTATTLGIPLVDAPAALQTCGCTLEATFMDSVHPTDAGHLLLGCAALDTLDAAGLLPPRRANAPRGPCEIEAQRCACRSVGTSPPGPGP